MQLRWSAGGGNHGVTERCDLCTVCRCVEQVRGAWLERGKAARKLAGERFEELAGTGFQRLSEKMVVRLLEEDWLGVWTEEVVFEAALRWMQAGDRG